MSVALGTAVSSSSSSVATVSSCIVDSAVTLLPGRARPATSPLPTGMLRTVTTIGIVAVAYLAASADPATMTSGAKRDRFGGELRQPLDVSFRPPALDCDILLAIAEGAQPLPERLPVRPGGDARPPGRGWRSDGASLGPGQPAAAATSRPLQAPGAASPQRRPPSPRSSLRVPDGSPV